MIYKKNFLLDQLDLGSYINENNSEFDSENNYKIIIYYTIKLNASIIIIPTN